MSAAADRHEDVERGYGSSMRGPPILRLRRSQHERMPSLSTYNAIRRTAEPARSVERDGARGALRERDPRAFVDALLGRRAPGRRRAQLAWDVSQAARGPGKRPLAAARQEPETCQPGKSASEPFRSNVDSKVSRALGLAVATSSL